MPWKSIHRYIPQLSGIPYLLDGEREDDVRQRLGNGGFEVLTLTVPVDVTEKTLLKLVGEALDFPDYYGVNWEAYNDCLYDLYMRPRFQAVVLVRDAHHLFQRDPHLFARAVYLLTRSVDGPPVEGQGDTQLEYVFLGPWSRLSRAE